MRIVRFIGRHRIGHIARKCEPIANVSTSDFRRTETKMACVRVSKQSRSERVGRIAVITIRPDRNHGATRSYNVEIKLTAYSRFGKSTQQSDDSYQELSKPASSFQ